MKRSTGYLFALIGILLITGIVSAVEIDYSRLIPPKTTGPCFNEDYWAIKHEKSLKAKSHPDIKGIDVSHHQGNIDLSQGRSVFSLILCYFKIKIYICIKIRAMIERTLREKLLY